MGRYAEGMKSNSRSKLTPVGYRILHSIVFSTNFPGYRPNVLELPNGDGKVDHGKRFAHVAAKYITDEYRQRLPGATKVLEQALDDAHFLAQRVATALRVPKHLMPSRDHSALRVLEYPAGAGSHEHTDFDLFTLMLYRDQPGRFVSDWHDMPSTVHRLNAQCHLGELAELAGIGKAVRHSVAPSDRPQRSAVYFAMPCHTALLRGGQSVGEWLSERMGRSRVEAAE